jgi:hypothetical protein
VYFTGIASGNPRTAPRRTAAGDVRYPYNPRDFWTEQSASDVKRWQMRHTDAEVRERITAIRLDPFVIRRRSPSS